MAYDRKIDSLTHDYVEDGLGGFQTTTSIATELHHQLLSERGRWVGDPDAGSDFHQLRAAGAADTDTTAKQAAEYTRNAVQPFLDAGRAADFQVATERDQSGRLVVTSSIRDIQHGAIDLGAIIPFGA
jgi:phage gp46-like protein